MPLDVPGFVRKWQASQHTERSAAQQHFRDLCEALGEQHPTEADEIGNSYAFEKRVAKVGGGEGFADVWKRGFFAWEYKSKGGDLKAAYKQINTYHEALENPPLLIVCDFERFEVHTKFENSTSRTYAFVLEDLLHGRDTPTCPLAPLEVLRLTFGDFNLLRPNVTSARVTEAAAADLLRLARELELERAANPQPYTKEQIAHFIMRLVFCLFADSVGLLRNHAFRSLVENQRFSPIGFNKILPTLFNAMSSPGGFFGADDVRYFNGDLFRPNDHILQLNQADLRILYSASQHNWGPYRAVHLRHPLRALPRRLQALYDRRALHLHRRHPPAGRARRGGSAPSPLGNCAGPRPRRTGGGEAEPPRPPEAEPPRSQHPSGLGRRVISRPHPRPGLRLWQLPLRRS